MNCKTCGKELGGRSDKKFCDAVCRVVYGRRCIEAEKKIDSMLIMCNSVYVTLAKNNLARNVQAIAKLKMLKSDIEHILRHYDREAMIDQSQKNELIAKMGRKK